MASEHCPKAFLFFAFRFGSLRDRFFAHAASLNALNAATLNALTICPRKARRDPTFALVYEAS